jgi:hypothetical protein
MIGLTSIKSDFKGERVSRNISKTIDFENNRQMNHGRKLTLRTPFDAPPSLHC